MVIEMGDSNNRGSSIPVVPVGFALVIGLLIASLVMQGNERKAREVREKQARIEKAHRIPPIRMIPMVHCFGENQRTCITLETPAMPEIE